MYLEADLTDYIRLQSSIVKVTTLLTNVLLLMLLTAVSAAISASTILRGYGS